MGCVAPVTGLSVLGLVPRNHWYASGPCPAAATCSVSGCPAVALWLCGSDRTTGGLSVENSRKLATVSAVSLRARRSSASHDMLPVLPDGQSDFVPPAMPVGSPRRSNSGFENASSRVHEMPRAVQAFGYAMMVRNRPGTLTYP